ncbi:bacterial methyltransferase [Ramicandelaber brevisporus]|nr:bacterial methyltransferase [Ramicandelaber brevisporus]
MKQEEDQRPLHEFFYLQTQQTQQTEQTQPREQSRQYSTLPYTPVHVPVLLHETLSVLAPAQGDVIVDCCFGEGGHTRAILDSTDCHVVAVDRDPSAFAKAQSLAQDARYKGRLTPVLSRFSQIGKLFDSSQADGELAKYRGRKVNGILMDLGISSSQLADASRGISFKLDGPLDMRMSTTGSEDGLEAKHDPRSIPASVLVNSMPVQQLADIIRDYGGERHSAKIANAIHRARQKAPITTTRQLAEAVHSVLPQRSHKDPAMRTFQALRICVNDELGELSKALQAAEQMLAPGGRLAVISFHDLEDRMVKRFMQERCTPTASAVSGDGEYDEIEDEESPAPFQLITRKGIKPSKDEISKNPRSRSAILRACIKQ